MDKKDAVSVLRLAEVNRRKDIPSMAAYVEMMEMASNGCESVTGVSVVPVGVSFDFDGDFESVVDSLVDDGRLVRRGRKISISNVGVDFCSDNSGVISTDEVETLEAAKTLYYQ